MYAIRSYYVQRGEVDREQGTEESGTPQRDRDAPVPATRSGVPDQPPEAERRQLVPVELDRDLGVAALQCRVHVPQPGDARHSYNFV